jgi:hypothetical protein
LGSGEIAWRHQKAVRLGPAWARASRACPPGYQPDGVGTDILLAEALATDGPERRVELFSAGDVIQRQHEQGPFDIKAERSDPRLLSAEETCNVSGASVANPQPDDLWRSTVQETSLTEIVVFRDNHESVVARVIPHETVGSAEQADIAHVAAARKFLSQQLHEPMAQVFVE